MARTAKELMELAAPIADQLAQALGVGRDDEQLTIAVVVDNGPGGGWASCIRGEEAVAEMMLRNAYEDAAAGGYSRVPIPIAPAKA